MEGKMFFYYKILDIETKGAIFWDTLQDEFDKCSRSVFDTVLLNKTEN